MSSIPNRSKYFSPMKNIDWTQDTIDAATAKEAADTTAKEAAEPKGAAPTCEVALTKNATTSTGTGNLTSAAAAKKVAAVPGTAAASSAAIAPKMLANPTPAAAPNVAAGKKTAPPPFSDAMDIDTPRVAPHDQMDHGQCRKVLLDLAWDLHKIKPQELFRKYLSNTTDRLYRCGLPSLSTVDI